MKDFLTLQFMPCHRRPERSLIVKGKKFPVCYRCMFILIGLFMSIPMAFFTPLFSVIPSFFAAVLMNVPMLIDGFTQKKECRTSNNPLRIGTGFLAGFGLAQFVVTSAKAGAFFIVN